MTRWIVAGAIAAALALPPAAGAQVPGLGPEVWDPILFEYNGAQVFKDNAGVAVAVLYSAYNQREDTSQTMTGAFGSALFTGVATYQHTYDRAENHGNYVLTGTADPTGASPPLPFYGTLRFEFDRVGRTYRWHLTGDLAGQPIDAQTAPIVSPI